MKLGIMQPYFFPYIGYFQLIHAVDLWVVFDTPQYIRHGWVNRNRILHPQAGSRYIILPLASHSKKVAINEVLLHPDLEWKTKIMAQLQAYYSKQAPFYEAVTEMVSIALDEEDSCLSRCLVKCLAQVCEYIGMEFKPIMASELELDSVRVEHAGQWALEISKLLGATQYINPIGGRGIFQPREFAKSNIKLSFLKSQADAYDQGVNHFFEALSILDVLMWNSKAETLKMLDNYTLESQQYLEEKK